MSRAREAARLIGNNTFTIDSNNNVGLGSTLPATKFELSGNSKLVGIVTATEFDISGSTNSLTSGGLVVGVATVGTAVTIRSTGVNVTGVTTSSGGFVGNLTGTATGLSGTPNITVNNVTSGNINSSGIVTATSFAGSGSNLTGLPAGYSDLDNALFG